LKSALVAFFVGVLFGAGLTISGMTMPHKVIAFLDVFGAWDPTLAFVMFGAIAVHFFAYRIAKRQTSPLLADRFLVPDKKPVDRSLIIGSIMFGIGWGLAGYCPGPAITSLVSFNPQVVCFVIAMAFGMWLHEKIPRLF